MRRFGESMSDFLNALTASLTDEERESNGCIRFLFQMTEDVPLADLREDTSLQRKVKSLLLRGEKIGTARGVLI